METDRYRVHLLDFHQQSHLTIPRKGMETYISGDYTNINDAVALNYSPQGDGNVSKPR